MPLLIKTTGFEEFLDPSGGAYIKALIMGDHGVGKTPSACSWPDPILADCEKGRMSVASMAVPYADIKNSADMEALLDYLRRECLKPVEKRKHKTLILDTVDTYQRKLIQERLKAERKESLSGWADWGWLDGKMIGLIESLLNLPMNVVVNMHTKDVSEEDGDESRLVQKARLKGDIKDAIFQDFDLIGRMEQSYVADPEKKGERKRVRQIRWHSEPKYPSLRDRSNKLPRFTDVTFTDQDFWQIFNTITADLDALPESKQVESLEVEGDDAEAPPADVEGGPVERPELPRPTGPAKKAAAKKAPAKKAAKKAVAPEPESATDVPAEDPWAPPAPAAGSSEETQVGTDVATSDPDQAAAAGGQATDPGTDVETDPMSVDDDDQAAEQLVKDELGGEVLSEELPEDKVQHSTTEPPAEEPKAKAAKHCGDQPASMVGKHEPVTGCGVELTAQNAGKAQISMIKFKTYLCDEDFAKQQGAAA